MVHPLHPLCLPLALWVICPVVEVLLHRGVGKLDGLDAPADHLLPAEEDGLLGGALHHDGVQHSEGTSLHKLEEGTGLAQYGEVGAPICADVRFIQIDWGYLQPMILGQLL